MERVYFLVSPSKEKGFDYYSDLGGNRGFSYYAEWLLSSVAKAIKNDYPDKIVVLRNNLPRSDPTREVLETLVRGHNLLLNLASREWKREAQRAIRKVRKAE